MTFRVSSALNSGNWGMSAVKFIGIRESLAVRPVRAEQDLVDADGVGQQLHVVLVVRRDPDVVPQLLERVLLKWYGAVLAAFFSRLIKRYTK